MAETSRGEHKSVDDRSISEYDLTVIGLGYVGLPLAAEACRVGLKVAGVDVSSSVTERLASGRSHVTGQTDAAVAAMLDEGFTPTGDYSVVAGSRVVVICVPTPLDAAGQPDLSAVRAAAAAVSNFLTQGTLVILESTTYPGTTDEILRPILETSGLVAGQDFSLAFSPERIDPGNDVYGVRNIPKVVGGFTPDCSGRAQAFYGKLCEQVVPTSGTREAEMSKLLENTYRQVNIALVNEMAMFCRELGIDLRDAINAASTKPFGFQAFHPGPGVGGHCIPVDPGYLAYSVRQLGYPFRIAELAQEINEAMPAYIARRIQDYLNEAGLPLHGSTVLVLGVTYKPDVVDDRGTPARPLVRRLRQLGAEVVFHDPYVPSWQVDDVKVPRLEDFAAADIAVLLQNHSAYDEASLATARRLLDTRQASGEGAHGHQVQYL